MVAVVDAHAARVRVGSSTLEAHPCAASIVACENEIGALLPDSICVEACSMPIVFAAKVPTGGFSKPIAAQDAKGTVNLRCGLVVDLRIQAAIGGSMGS